MEAALVVAALPRASTMGQHPLLPCGRRVPPGRRAPGVGRDNPDGTRRRADYGESHQHSASKHSLVGDQAAPPVGVPGIEPGSSAPYAVRSATRSNPLPWRRRPTLHLPLAERYAGTPPRPCVEAITLHTERRWFAPTLAGETPSRSTLPTDRKLSGTDRRRSTCLGDKVLGGGRSFVVEARA